MRIPKNIIKTGKYTSGGELVYKETQTSYKGYYYILSNRYFVGKEYVADAPELIKIQQSNTLLFRPSTAIFSAVSGITSKSLRSPKVSSIQPNIESNPTPVRYFSQQINVKPITIKEISKETYDSLQGNSLYNTTFVGPTQNIDQANQQMPGLKSFLIG
jgi:hypothetical protein